MTEVRRIGLDDESKVFSFFPFVPFGKGVKGGDFVDVILLDVLFTCWISKSSLVYAEDPWEWIARGNQQQSTR